MVKCIRPALDTTFSALSDPTRRAIVDALADGAERRVSDLAAPFDMSLPAVLKHLAKLERAGLITQRKAGRERRCRLRPEPMRQASDWLTRYRAFWASQLDSLGAFLETPTDPEDPT